MNRDTYWHWLHWLLCWKVIMFSLKDKQKKFTRLLVCLHAHEKTGPLWQNPSLHDCRMNLILCHHKMKQRESEDFGKQTGEAGSCDLPLSSTLSSTGGPKIVSPVWGFVSSTWYRPPSSGVASRITRRLSWQGEHQFNYTINCLLLFTMLHKCATRNAHHQIRLIWLVMYKLLLCKCLYIILSPNQALNYGARIFQEAKQHFTTHLTEDTAQRAVLRRHLSHAVLGKSSEAQAAHATLEQGDFLIRNAKQQKACFCLLQHVVLVQAHLSFLFSQKDHTITP